MKKITTLLLFGFTSLLMAQTPPTIDCPMDSTSPVLGASCDAVVNFVTPTATDAEDGDLTVTQTLGLPSGSAFPLGDTLQEFSATDSDGNTVTCQFTITVADSQPPVALCQNVTIQLDGDGLATLDATQVDAGSFDTCGIASLAVSQTDFSCDDLFTSVDDPLYITGVLDGPLPGGAPKALELYVAADIADLSLYGIGSANNGGGSDGEEFTFPAVSATAGNYIYVALGAFDFFDFFGFFPDYEDGSMGINGDDAMELFFNGSVIDVFGDINVDGSGQVWEYQDGWAYRNDNTTPSPIFNPSDWTYSGPNALDNETSNATAVSPFPIGSYSFEPTAAPPVNVTLTVTDTSGNISSCVAQVTIEDSVAPDFTMCPAPVSATTDADSCTASGVALGTPMAIDNCSVLSITNDAPAQFELGETIVNWTAVDTSGNETVCEQVVTVTDGTIPNVVCENITVQLDENGMVTVTPEQADGGTTDNCELASLSLSVTEFSCENIGPNNVALTATDAAGNINTCVVTITVEDILMPTVVCQNITVALNENGTAEITPDQIDNGSEDNCGIDTLSLSQTVFTCENLGENTVVLLVTDVNGNTNECEATVTVIDETAPIVTCENITVALGETGEVTIEPAQVNAGSEDNCEVENIAIEPATFTCENIGENEVVVTVTDTSGNETTCTAIVTIIDETAPVIACESIELELNAEGSATLIVDEVITNVEDNCGIEVIEASTEIFTCEDVGENEVTITVVDVNGNEATCTTIVTIVDNFAPTAVCQNIVVILDENGVAEITADQLDGGSSDNCGDVTFEIDTTTFSCMDVGENEVTLFVIDGNDNIQDCTAIVTVVDNTAPIAVCQNITVELNEDGEATIDAEDIDGGSTDNCEIVSYEIDITEFDCSNQGENVVILTVEDASGNVSTCEAIVTVASTNAPEAECQNISVTLDENGEAILSPLDIYAGDDAACNLSISQELFTCEDLGGPVEVILTSTNSNGDTSTCTAIVTVVDNIFPTITCPEEPVVVAAIPLYELPDYLENGTVIFEDNCPNEITYVQTPEAGTLVDEGETEVTIEITDAGGNEIQCSFIVIVDPSLQVGETAGLQGIEWYPNPAENVITLVNKNNLQLTQASIYDLSGRLVQQVDLTTMLDEKTIDISQLASANYIFIIESNTAQRVERILKK